MRSRIRTRPTTWLAASLLLATLALIPARVVHAHGEVMRIGSSQAGSGQLRIGSDFDFDADAYLALSLMLGSQSLYEGIIPSFAWIYEDIATDQIFTVKAGTLVQFVITAVAPGASAVLGGRTLDQPNASATLGTFSPDPEEHVHATWRLLVGSGEIGRYSISFKLRALSGGYSESPIYTLHLNNGTPPPTATATQTATPTPSPSITPTLPPTSTPTLSPSATVSATPTATPELSSTPTLSPQPTATFTAPPPTATATATATPIGAPGDANCDRRFSAADIVALIDRLPSGVDSVCGADVDRNGSVTDTDLDRLLAMLFR